MELPLHGREGMVSSVLNPSGDPSSESLFGCDAPGLWSRAVRKSNRETNFELYFRTERAQGYVEWDLKAPDIIRGRNRNFDDDHPIDRIPLTSIGREIGHNRRRDRWVVLFALRAGPFD